MVAGCLKSCILWRSLIKAERTARIWHSAAVHLDAPSFSTGRIVRLKFGVTKNTLAWAAFAISDELRSGPGGDGSTIQTSSGERTPANPESRTDTNARG